MNTSSLAAFRWASPLGVSVALFLLINAAYLVMGLLAPIAFRLFGPELSDKFGLVFSPRTDTAVFGRSAAEIAREQPAAQVIKVSVYDMLSGLYLAVAILHFPIVWLGLRQGQAWSLWTLTAADLAIVLLFALAVHHYSAHLVQLRITDLFPYVLVPAFILPFAAVLGWIGLR